MAKSRTSGKDSINVLFTCIGRRVSLLNSFKKSAKQLGINTKLFGTDITELSPALQLCDKKLIIKPISHSAYIKQLLDITKKHKKIYFESINPMELLNLNESYKYIIELLKYLLFRDILNKSA